MNDRDNSRSHNRLDNDNNNASPYCCPHCRRIKLLTIKEVAEWIVQSKRNIHRLVMQGIFPKPIKVGIRSRRWVESEVNEWLEKQMLNRI